MLKVSRFVVIGLVVSSQAFAQTPEGTTATTAPTTTAPPPTAATTAQAPTATPAPNVEGCYPGKQNGEDVLFCPRPGAAAVPSVPTDRATEWYGWQTLLADGASIGLIIGGGVATGSGSNSSIGSMLSTVGSLGYLIGGPIVHLANGRPLPALGSLGLRAGLPVGGGLVGILVGLAACDRSSGGDFGSGLCVVALGALGFVGGAIAAIAADAAWLARKPVEPPKPQQGMRWLPDLSLSPTGGSAGVRGSF
jgi:hypothetical protein